MATDCGRRLRPLRGRRACLALLSPRLQTITVRLWNWLSRLPVEPRSKSEWPDSVRNPRTESGEITAGVPVKTPSLLPSVSSLSLSARESALRLACCNQVFLRVRKSGSGNFDVSRIRQIQGRIATKISDFLDLRTVRAVT